MHVAEHFGKRHDHVLRDIDELLTSPDLGALNWFWPAQYVDPKGEMRPSFDLTRQGFTLLVMGTPPL
jgi:Rha family phage regulatory protein